MDKKSVWYNVLSVVGVFTLLFGLYNLYNAIFLKTNPNALPIALTLILAANIANLIRMNMFKEKKVYVAPKKTDRKKLR